MKQYSSSKSKLAGCCGVGGGGGDGSGKGGE